MAAAATVRGCSSKLAKRACHNLVFKPKQVQATREILRLQGEQGFEPQLAKRACSNLAFVPQHKETQERDIELLQEFLNPSKRLLVLTGAGISTESGIPDYRSEGVGLYATSSKRPIQHKTFMESLKARQSYWARNFVGWPRWSSTRPNSAHLTLAAWERKGRLRHVVTQNVDQLHYKAGCKNVVELHGTNSLVKCMTCSFSIPRMTFQRRLEELNPTMETLASEQMMKPDGDVELSPEEVANFRGDLNGWPWDELRPDGDVEIAEEIVDKFRVPNCPKCDTGILKPYVVFFGDNVPKPRVEFVRKQVEESDALLVVGSSLFVFSGYRFVTQARDLGIPIAVVNIGPTRADAIVDLKIEAKAGDVLPKILL